jgi:hypothetical protein
VLECDAVGCAIFNVQPYLVDYVDVYDLPEADVASLPYEFITVDLQIRQTFLAMRSLCATMETYMPASPTSPRHIFSPKAQQSVDKAALNDFVAKRSVIEYRLLTLHTPQTCSDDEAEDDEDEESATPVVAVLTLGAKIFTNLVFRKMTPSSIIHMRLAQRLRTAILDMDRHPSSQHLSCLPLLLWVSVLGCMAVQAGPLRVWFLGWIVHCCSEMDVSEESDFKYQLSKVCWIEGLLGSMCSDIWREMEEMGRMGVEVRFVGEGDS